MRNTILSAAALAIFAVGAPSFLPAQTAQAEAAATINTGGDFIKKRKTLKGSYSVEERGGETFIVFSDDFKAAKGPDLKVFLSPKSVADVTGKTATDGSLNLGELTSFKGQQAYRVPAGTDLSAYGSVLVHCEEYAVLWGGSDL